MVALEGQYIALGDVGSRAFYTSNGTILTAGPVTCISA